jgi:hypothetical protein
MDFYTEEQSYLFEYAYNVQVFMFSGIMLHSNVVPNEVRLRLKSLLCSAHVCVCECKVFFMHALDAAHYTHAG